MIAMQAHDTLETEMKDEEAIKRMELNSNLLQLFAEMDTDESGELTKDSEEAHTITQ